MKLLDQEAKAEENASKVVNNEENMWISVRGP
jgi:hypothetical protein